MITWPSINGSKFLWNYIDRRIPPPSGMSNDSVRADELHVLCPHVALLQPVRRPTIPARMWVFLCYRLVASYQAFDVVIVVFFVAVIVVVFVTIFVAMLMAVFIAMIVRLLMFVMLTGAWFSAYIRVCSRSRTHCTANLLSATNELLRSGWSLHFEVFSDKYGRESNSWLNWSSYSVAEPKLRRFRLTSQSANTMEIVLLNVAPSLVQSTLLCSLVNIFYSHQLYHTIIFNIIHRSWPQCCEIT